MTRNVSSDDLLIPTRDSLLSRLKDWQDDSSWREFFNTYWRLIYGVALKSGLNEQEAEEVVQETLVTVARRIPEFSYDRKVCSFKTWLMNLTRWRIIDQIRKRRTAAPHGTFPITPAETEITVEHLADPASLSLHAVWEEEWRSRLMEAAIQAVKAKVNPEHYQIFHLCVFKEHSVKQVAAELGVGVTQVYLAKHRVGAALKREIQRIEARMDRDQS